MGCIIVAPQPAYPRRVHGQQHVHLDVRALIQGGLDRTRKLRQAGYAHGPVGQIRPGDQHVGDATEDGVRRLEVQDLRAQGRDDGVRRAQVDPWRDDAEQVRDGSVRHEGRVGRRERGDQWDWRGGPIVRGEGGKVVREEGLDAGLEGGGCERCGEHIILDMWRSGTAIGLGFRGTYVGVLGGAEDGEGDGYEALGIVEADVPEWRGF